MKLSEISIPVAANGDLLVPASIMREMGLHGGDLVQIAYLTKDGVRNDFHEFLLSSGGVDEAEDSVSFQVPDTLLQQANMKADEDVKLVCLDGCIVICKDRDLDHEALLDVLDSLKKANELTSDLPSGLREVQDQLSEIVNELIERSGE